MVAKRCADAQCGSFVDVSMHRAVLVGFRPVRKVKGGTVAERMFCPAVSRKNMTPPSEDARSLQASMAEGYRASLAAFSSLPISMR